MSSSSIRSPPPTSQQSGASGRVGGGGGGTSPGGQGSVGRGGGGGGGGPTPLQQHPSQNSNSGTPSGTPGGSPALPAREDGPYDDGQYNTLSRRSPGYGYGGYSGSYGGRYGGGYGGYGSSYGGYGGSYGGYGGYGGYGSGYGGYNGGYGGYGGGYGGYGGYNNNRLPPGKGWIDNGMNSIQYIQSITNCLARFAELLTMNAEAVHGSFDSILGLLQIFSHLKHEVGYILSGLTLFKFLSSMISKLLGIKEPVPASPSPSSTTPAGMNMASEFKKKNRGVSWGTILVLAFVGCGVVMLYRGWKKILKKLEEEQEDEEEEPQKEEIKEVEAAYDFRGQRNGDLMFREGDVIRVLEKPFSKWWFGELVRTSLGNNHVGMRGLFPVNFVKFKGAEIDLKAGLTPQLKSNSNSVQ